MKRKKLPARPAPPSIEQAIRLTQPAADVSGLPQMPYAGFDEHFGWWVDSTTYQFPENAEHFYQVSVLPSDYCRPCEPLW